MPPTDDDFDDPGALDDVVGSLGAVRRGREQRGRSVFLDDVSQPAEVLSPGARSVAARDLAVARGGSTVFQADDVPLPQGHPVGSLTLDPLEPTERPSAKRSRSVAPTTARSRILTGGFSVFLLAAIVAIGLISAWAVQAIRNSADGEIIEATPKAPDEPGFEALLAPTPSLAMFHVDGEIVRSVTVIALAGDDGDDGGTMLFVPPSLLVSDDSGTATTLSATFAQGGLDAARQALAVVLDVGFVNAVEVGDDAIATLVSGVGGIEIRVSDRLFDETGTIVDAGLQDLDPDTAARYFGFLNAGESEINLAIREELFWEAYLGAVRSGGAATGDPTLVRFVEGLAAGPVDYRRLPADPVSGLTGTVYEAQDLATRTLALEMMPFPVEATPGARPRVRLLDGVGDFDRFFDVARRLVSTGAQVSVIGNADTFQETTTTITYLDPVDELSVQGFVFALGAGELIADFPAEIPEGLGYDITVVIGQDLQLPDAGG